MIVFKGGIIANRYVDNIVTLYKYNLHSIIDIVWYNKWIYVQLNDWDILNRRISLYWGIK